MMCSNYTTSEQKFNNRASREVDSQRVAIVRVRFIVYINNMEIL
jgi:hypothetical protein